METQSSPFELYKHWVDLQELELHHLTLALSHHDSQHHLDQTELTRLIDKTVKNFENYAQQRARLSKTDPSPFLAAQWCTTLETSGLWLGGCRPSSYIRLLYALCGLEEESRLIVCLGGFLNKKLEELSPEQLAVMDGLRMRVIKEEERLSREMASLQEEMVDLPLVEGALNKADEVSCGSEGRVDAVLDENRQAAAALMEEADKVRVETLKELLEILTKIQGVRFLAAGKKINVCMREWGKRRDEHGD